MTDNEGGVDRPVQRVEVRWRYLENRQMQQVYAKLANPAALNVYPLESYNFVETLQFMVAQ